MAFSFFVPSCIILITLNADTVLGARVGLVNQDFEGCIRMEDDASGEPIRGQSPPKQKKIHKQNFQLFDPDGHAPIQQPPRFDKANEPKYTISPKNLNYKQPIIDTGFHSSMLVSSTEVEEAIQNADRHTLNKWKEHGDQLKELLELVEQGPSLCDAPPLGPPILDTKKRINHAIETLDHKLRYGTIRRTEEHRNSEDEGEQD